MRKFRFTNNEYYHILNRGVDKREVFLDYNDTARFFQSMHEFNTIEPIGSIFENSFRPFGHLVSKDKNLVDFICYCLNLNHYHFILKQAVDFGIEKFMHRLGNGYTKYFNNKYERSGSLFQGSYKATHIDTNEYLLHASVYVNLNNKVHFSDGQISDLTMSSWKEYINDDDKVNFCKKDIILGQFDNSNEYKNFAENSLVDIRERKELSHLDT